MKECVRSFAPQTQYLLPLSTHKYLLGKPPKKPQTNEAAAEQRHGHRLRHRLDIAAERNRNVNMPDVLNPGRGVRRIDCVRRLRREVPRSYCRTETRPQRERAEIAAASDPAAQLLVGSAIMPVVAAFRFGHRGGSGQRQEQPADNVRALRITRGPPRQECPLRCTRQREPA